VLEKTIRPKGRSKKSESDKDREERRILCEGSLIEFAKLVRPRLYLGNIQKDSVNWITRLEGKRHKMLLLPREHLKSTIAALYAAWLLTKNPETRILYISSTANLAIKQLKSIKDIITCDNYRIHWPEMVNKDEAKREKWTEREISVDHSRRKEFYTRDPTIFTAGLTTNIVGMHCDHAILDDVVVAGNAYTEDGRGKVQDQYSLLSSIETTEGTELVVGTRYHPLDLYGTLLEREIEYYDDVGNVSTKEPLFEVKEHQVESVGDGSGEFLWPREKQPDGRWYGFNREVLNEKKQKYINNLHFRAQYYNDPNDVSQAPINRDFFQYYEPGLLFQRDGRWSLKGERLNVFAAVDFAYTVGKRSDYTSLVVVGVDARHNFYVLDIDRFKTDKISEYFVHILQSYQKWGYRRLRAEVSAAQAVIVADLKENYIRPYGLSLAVEEFRPSRWQGSKEERIMATLEPKYANRQIWHYRAGNCQVLEEELVFANPAHDDVKDALASCIDMAQTLAPLDIFKLNKSKQAQFNFNTRFGGVQ